MLCFGLDQSGHFVFDFLVAQIWRKRLESVSANDTRTVDTFERLMLLLAKTYQVVLSIAQAATPRSIVPYLANTFGSTPDASLIMIGMLGLFLFIVGYARLRKEL